MKFKYFYKLPEVIQIQIYKIIFEEVLYSIRNMVGPVFIVNYNQMGHILPIANNQYTYWPRKIHHPSTKLCSYDRTFINLQRWKNKLKNKV